MKRPPAILAPALAALFGTTLTGCVMPANDRLAIGESLEVEAIGPRPTPVAPTAASQVATPSLTGISRDHWAPLQYHVPVDGTVHTRIYAKRTFWADKTARQRGEYPTALSALEMINGSEDQQGLEALNNQFRAVTDLVLLIPRMAIWLPWVQKRSPDDAYTRYNRPERPPVPADGPTRVTP